MNSEVMTLASEDAFAVYVDDGYESVEGYTQYSQYTDDKYSMVDTNKNITMDSSQINITQEKIVNIFHSKCQGITTVLIYPPEK